MTEQYDPNNSPEATSNVCMEQLIGSLAALRQAGFLPPSELPVGTLVGIRDTEGREIALRGPEVPFCVSSDGNVAFTAEQVDIAKNYVTRLMLEASPGTARLRVYNGTGQGTFGELLSKLGPLAEQHSEPDGPRTMLNSLWATQSEVALGGEQVGTPTRPREVVVIIDPRPLDNLADHMLTNLAGGEGVARVITVGLPPGNYSENVPNALPDRAIVAPGQAPSGNELSTACAEIISIAAKGGEPPALDTVLPPKESEELMKESAVDGLKFACGVGPDGKPYEVTLKGSDSHMSVEGSIGSGKSVVIRTMLQDLSSRYPSTEVKVFFLDGKSSDHAPLAPSNKKEEFNPNVAVLGTNLEGDPSFGLAVIQHVNDQIRERAVLFSRAGVTNYEEYRRQEPEAKLPRIVLGIDELQVFLTRGIDGEGAKRALEDIARRGRSVGIHVLLATQTKSGIDALAVGGSKGLYDQINVRFDGTMPAGVSSDPERSRLLPMHFRVTTSTSKAVVRVGKGYEPLIAPRRKQVYDEARRRDPALRPPRVFDGRRVPVWQGSKERESTGPSESGVRSIVVGAAVSMEKTMAQFPLARVSGRNLAVVCADADTVGDIMATSADSIARQLRPGQDSFTIAYLAPEYRKQAERNAQNLMNMGHQVRLLGPNEAPEFFIKTHESLENPENHGQGDYEPTKLLFVYGANSGGSSMTKKNPIEVASVKRSKMDAFSGTSVQKGSVIGTNLEDGSRLVAPCDGTIEKRGDTVYIRPSLSGRDHLSALAKDGPDYGHHVVAHWPDAKVMKETVDSNAFGGYVASGVHGASLATMTPGVFGAGQSDSAPPEGRAFFFDATQHSKRARPEVVVPYTFKNA